jgi:hypothetical protein
MCTNVGDDDVARCLPCNDLTVESQGLNGIFAGVVGGRVATEGGGWMFHGMTQHNARTTSIQLRAAQRCRSRNCSKLCVIGTFVRCTLSIFTWEGHVHRPFVYAPSPSQDSGVWASTGLQRELLEFRTSTIVPDLINWNSKTSTT